VACAEASLCGYVSADASVNDLARAARRVARGETICSAGMAESLFRHLGDAARGVAAVGAALTWRQRQILQLIKEGLSNKEIAQRLSLGPSTVKNHVHGLLGRLQVGRRGEAAALFDRGGARSGMV
jgi:two-component system nitrate/nitrite response regulator NarL